LSKTAAGRPASIMRGPMEKTESAACRLRVAVYAAIFLLLACSLSAEQLPVRFMEGEIHAFVALRNLKGAVVASGDLIQNVRRDKVTTRLEIHFKDGSLHDETAVLSQRGRFRLLSDHMIETGPSFDSPIELWIDALKGQVRIRDMREGKGDISTQHVVLPADLANGIVFVLAKNIPPTAATTTLSILVATPKPRVVKLTIGGQEEDTFLVEGSKRQAKHYLAKVEIGGIAGVVAPLVGKEPPNTDLWVLEGEAPALLRAQGPLSGDSPVWRIELTCPVWP
jgi:hypothetical protein